MFINQFFFTYHISPRFCLFSCTSTLFEPRVLVKLLPASRDVGLLDGLKHFETHLGLSEIGYPQNKRHALSLFSLLFNDHSVFIPHFQTPFFVFAALFGCFAWDQRPQETVKKLLPGKVSTMKTVGLLDHKNGLRAG